MASGGGKATAMNVRAGTVEALTDRHAGLCRWSHAFRSVQQRAGSEAGGNGAACGKGKAAPSAAGAAVRRRKARQEQEDELRTVMYLSNWGPNN